LLAGIVAAARDQIRDMDVLGRFAADELVLCFSGLTLEEAQSKIENIRTAVARRVLGKPDIPVELTIGILSLTSNADLKRRIQDIFAGLGRKLIAAKAKGTGHVVAGRPDA
jgi:GGDEF domain-containing protein